MLDLDSMSAATPIPPVDLKDLRRVWEFTSQSPQPEGGPACSTGWDLRLIEEQCSQGADPVAVFFRVALLGPLLQSGLLDNWRDGERPFDIVFEALADYPLPEGVQGFRPDAFAEALTKAE
jgi:hypothetical protein